MFPREIILITVSLIRSCQFLGWLIFLSARSIISFREGILLDSQAIILYGLWWVHCDLLLLLHCLHILRYLIKQVGIRWNSDRFRSISHSAVVYHLSCQRHDRYIKCISLKTTTSKTCLFMWAGTSPAVKVRYYVKVLLSFHSDLKPTSCHLKALSPPGCAERYSLSSLKKKQWQNAPLYCGGTCLFWGKEYDELVNIEGTYRILFTTPCVFGRSMTKISLSLKRILTLLSLLLGPHSIPKACPGVFLRWKIFRAASAKYQYSC